MPQNAKNNAIQGRETQKKLEMNDNSPVNFIYKTMVERDPKKRKVKPIEKGFDLFNLPLEDTSSDDEDYKPRDLEDDDDELDDDFDDDECSDSDEPEVEACQTVNENKEWPKSVVETVETGLSSVPLELSTKVTKLLVCAVCSEDVTHENDEIVECDSCGITVHEGCYGVTNETDNDNESIHSNASSSSTEPWFCDACKANVSSPVCELCPNSGGIFKQSDVGRWVHLVCALYIPGVAFADTNRLTGVTLFELPYDRWESKPCSLCEDERLSRTGISICCDAGMCKTYFHVTCAQAHGLLYEAQNTDETELVDPFYAHCKLHAGDKFGVKTKRRNWLALQSKQRLRSQQQSGQQLNERILKKLNKAREKWKIANSSRSPPWIPQQKTPRMLTTCPSAVRKLIRKSELLGLSPQTQFIVSHDIDVRRKWYVPPTFTVEFVSYYLDRNNRMNSMQSRLDDLQSQNRQLKESEEISRKRYEELLRHCDSLRAENSKYKTQAKDLWTLLSKLSKSNLNVPKLLDSPDEKKHTKKHGKGVDGNAIRDSILSSPGSVVLNPCGICRKTQDQHLLALCDSCKLKYHLYCLDPPLSRMPKKTRFGGWQCSDCTEKEDTQSDGTHSNQSLVDAPRRLREHVKGPNKFVPDADNPSLNSGHLGIKKRKWQRKPGEKKRGRKRKIPVEVYNIDDYSNTANGSSSVSMSISISDDADASKKLAIKLDEECCKCKQVSPTKHLVQCDSCLLHYHFTCLIPPQKKSPKRRGYQWLCDECGDSENPSDIEDGEDEEDDDDDDDDIQEVRDSE